MYFDLKGFLDKCSISLQCAEKSKEESKSRYFTDFILWPIRNIKLKFFQPSQKKAEVKTAWKLHSNLKQVI